MARRPREFPVEIPDYIQEHRTLPLGVGRPSTFWIMRSEYERQQANRLIDHKIYFEYEEQQMEYRSKVHGGLCLNCGSDNVGSHRRYTPDFYFPYKDLFIELKGKFDSKNRTKMKDVTTQSDSDIRMVFMRDNYLTRTKKMTYGRWCTINKIPYAIGDIPLEWLD